MKMMKTMPVLWLVFLGCVWGTCAQDLMSPRVDIISVLINMEARLNMTETQVGELKKQNEALAMELKDVKEELKRETTDRPKVAFSASLSTLQDGFEFIGPFSTDYNLIYRNAITNIGEAYSPHTGIFTAPVRGVYYFSFTVFTVHSYAGGVNLLRNGQRVVSVSDNPPAADSEDTGSNSASLLLEKGEQVYLQLWRQRRIYTDKNRRNTFSGHLLYTM